MHGPNKNMASLLKPTNDNQHSDICDRSVVQYVGYCTVTMYIFNYQRVIKNSIIFLASFHSEYEEISKIYSSQLNEILIKLLKQLKRLWCCPSPSPLHSKTGVRWFLPCCTAPSTRGVYPPLVWDAPHSCEKFLPVFFLKTVNTPPVFFPQDC